EYGKFLAYINNNYDFQVLLSELLGELNVSHTGGRYYPKFKNAEHTASLGLLYDQKYKGEGIKISAVIPGGPMDKADSKIEPGDLITQINGQKIEADENWNKYLTNLKDKHTRIRFKRDGKTFDETVKPVSLGTEHNLMYKRWTHIMDRLTDSLSLVKLVYVH